ncbi:MAG: SHOCT domain-containing protein [Selenomonadaceae bacterium]|nr:SHOCT domain-containing protein [Selenomonadaceae bacterium]
MVPVLIGLAALGGAALLASDSSRSEPPKDMSEVPEEIKQKIDKANEQELRIEVDNNGGEEKATKRVIDESEVPDAVLRKINIQEKNKVFAVIDKLKGLYKTGFLTEEEFTEKKKKLVVLREINTQETDKIFAAIDKLSDLYKDGILTEEEFTAKKKKLLSRL